VFGVPVLADLLTPYIPDAVERKFGEAVDHQVRAVVDDGQKGQAFECGQADAEKEGREALDRLVGRLEGSAALPLPIRAAVLRKPEANAFAIPGGHVYLFQGLIDKAETVDELAGVI